MDVSLDCGRLKFPATQNPSSDANTLDDYEEGTWTPTVTSGTGSITSYTSSGRYTKIGRVVQYQVEIAITNAGTGASTMNFTTPMNSNSAGPYGTCNGLEVGVTGVSVAGYTSLNSTTTSTYLATGGSPVVTGRTYYINGTYFV
jgi:hypothetical protein